MRRWGLVLLLWLSLGVNLGVAGMLVWEKARAKPPEPPPPELPQLGGGEDLIARLPRFADSLGLEGAERQKFLDIHVAFFQDTTRLRLRLAEVHRDLRRELSGEKPDPARIDKLLRESAGVYLKMEQSFAQSVLDSRVLLGSDQERRYLQVVSRLRGAVRGPLVIAPAGGGGPPGNLAPQGLPNGGFRPLQRPGAPRFRQEGMQGQPPGALPQGWPGQVQGRGAPPGDLQQQRLQRLRWRQMQRERLLQQRRPPEKEPPPAATPPPVY